MNERPDSVLPVSVIIVSRGRPDILKRCLLGISQLQYERFEVIVVADPDGITAAQQMPFADALKLLPFDEPNISAARNLGLTHAAGEVIAYIDDDAVPEPQWLRYLVAPAGQSDVAAMGGYVRGRNGISFQWQARSIDAMGESHELDIDPHQTSILTPPKGRAIKTEGTNMAFRRDVLVQLGGFDPAFHYFLDETDLNMRLAKAGHATALVPVAEVHHGFAANATRSAARVPRDLFDIGASWAVFQRKHINTAEHKDQWGRLRADQRRRLLRHMATGGLEPRDVRRLLKRLDQGYLEGQTRPFGPAKLATHPAQPFAPFPYKPRKSVILPTRPLRARNDLANAVERVNNEEIVTLINLSRTAIYHRCWFDISGLWIQKGGLFGKSDRKMPLLRITTRSRRLSFERSRVASQRGLREE
jgi:GT2 family glycosyltransferase